MSVRNPIVIHGSGGAGKTHRLYEMARRFREEHPTGRLMHVTVEEMVNRLVSSLRAGGIEDFRRISEPYLALMMVDDVDLTAGRTRTRAELSVLFETLREVGCQIVLTQSVSPRRARDDKADALDRFLASGRSVHIRPPGLFRRLALVNQRAGELGTRIPFLKRLRLAWGRRNAGEMREMVDCFRHRAQVTRCQNL